ncbi:uncharacterized protein [Nicotiana sylvestris]|uniref:uncharacterized protein n=1 Tax=Nicotiana sylvestris TaxID=4096 RepID=UPI00388C681E
MASGMTIPWLVRGDFNVSWDEEEKFGGLPVSLNEVDNFRHCINTCNLTDLGFKGSIYTWWNGRSEEDWVEVSQLSKIGSDHCPMLLKCDTESLTIKKSFRFLNFWVQHASFKDLVKENWKADFAANPFVTFNHKLKKLKKALSTCSKATYGDIFQKIASLEEVVEEEDQIAAEAVKFYQEQFREDTIPTTFHIIDHIPSMVTMEQNEKLNSNPTREEIKHAVFGLNGDSAGGPNGFTGIFYQSC